MQAGAAAPTCKHLSPHQHRAESFTPKRDAGEGNQRGGGCSAGYEHIVFFLNIKLFIFYCSGHFQHPLSLAIRKSLLNFCNVCGSICQRHGTERQGSGTEFIPTRGLTSKDVDGTSTPTSIKRLESGAHRSARFSCPSSAKA